MNVLANRLRLNDLVARHARALAGSAPYIGLVTMPRDSDDDFPTNGGRAVERLWLTATYLGLLFSPSPA